MSTSLLSKLSLACKKNLWLSTATSTWGKEWKWEQVQNGTNECCKMLTEEFTNSEVQSCAELCRAVQSKLQEMQHAEVVPCCDLEWHRKTCCARPAARPAASQTATPGWLKRQESNKKATRKGQHSLRKFEECKMKMWKWRKSITKSIDTKSISLVTVRVSGCRKTAKHRAFCNPELYFQSLQSQTHAWKCWRLETFTNKTFVVIVFMLVHKVLEVGIRTRRDVEACEL